MIFTISTRIQFEAESFEAGETKANDIRDGIQFRLPTVGRFTSWNFHWNENLHYGLADKQNREANPPKEEREDGK